MILTIVLLLTLFTVVLTLILSARRLKNYNFGRFFLLIAVGLLIAGILLITYSSDKISTALLRQSWPATTATVVEINIVGERASNPELNCEYEVERKKYALITDLNTPGFGRKLSRRQTAEIILDDYPVGSEVRIHYNPENPAEAYIRTGPYWSDYMRLSLGVLLFAIGLYGVLGSVLQKINLTSRITTV